MTPRFGRTVVKNDETLLAATVDVLAGTLGLRDGHTGEHSNRVVEVACRIGERLHLGRRELRDLGYAARLHDIGKVGVPDAVLHKAGPLADDERLMIQGHSVWGADLVGRIPGLEDVARIVRHHHERYDGEGYPDELAGRDIPLSSRILTVADAYVAMTEDRPYRRARPRFEVDREFRDCAGRQFDPYVVEALREAVAAPGG
ncbi:MAG: HD-GYP domain-containing protein [Thermoleophilaceae bacterium]|nr:HD-GYP domain-containing protein [Thermoleophilaceae bacterium]